MDKKDSARIKRGETSDDFDKKYDQLKNDKLVFLLNNNNPQIRTSASKILGDRRYINAVSVLCKRLSIEKALYTKIAISNSLGNIGLPSLNELLKYVGKIGSNRHEKLPDDIFKKWNYPLPRDIIIRTIIKIGEPALKDLCKFVLNTRENIVSEIIDAIGFISFYSKNHNSFDKIILLLKKHKNNKIIIWKIIRALQAFPNENSVLILSEYLQSSEIPQFRWEAARSLGQIGNDECIKILNKFINDNNALVSKMIELSLSEIFIKESKK